MLMLVLSCTSLLAQAGAAGPASSQAVRPIGVITAIGVPRRITLKTDAGSEMSISIEEATRFLQVSPGAKDLANAAAISMSDLTVGDRILVRGRSAGDSGTLVAASIVVMSKADIARKLTAERVEWEKRGVAGVITTLNPAAREMSINRSIVNGTRPMVIAVPPEAVLRRYAPNSVRFSDARPGRFEELQVGDQVKALGAASQDQTRFTAEELVSGSFRNIAATVVVLEPGGNTLQITDMATNKRIEARVTQDSTLRRLPAKADLRNLHSLIESLPVLRLTDLKPGEAIILGCTNSGDLGRVTAITVLAGAEPFLNTSSRSGRPPDIGSWNLDLNMNVGLP